MSRRGFTLAEALVALAVFALLFSAAWDFATNGFRLFRRGAARLDALHGAAFALERIKAELREAADSIRVRNAHPDAPVPRNDAIRFTRAGEGDGRATEVEIAFDPASRRVLKRTLGRTETIGEDVLALDIEVLKFPLPGARPALPALLVEVRQTVEGEGVPFRAVVVPRVPGRSVLDPCWVDNATGDTLTFDIGE